MHYLYVAQLGRVPPPPAAQESVEYTKNWLGMSTESGPPSLLEEVSDSASLPPPTCRAVQQPSIAGLQLTVVHCVLRVPNSGLLASDLGFLVGWDVGVGAENKQLFKLLLFHIAHGFIFHAAGCHYAILTYPTAPCDLSPWYLICQGNESSKRKLLALTFPYPCPPKTLFLALSVREAPAPECAAGYKENCSLVVVARRSSFSHGSTSPPLMLTRQRFRNVPSTRGGCQRHAVSMARCVNGCSTARASNN